jgi:CheY-like chemotaxis protein
MLQQAVEKGDPFALVLADFQMPKMDGLQLAERIRGSSSLSGTLTVLLASTDMSYAMPGIEKWGVNAHLAKPIRQFELRAAITKAIAKRPERAGNSEARSEAPARPQVNLQVVPQTRVLLVEDNVVNQRLATRLLEKHGCVVMVASNGRDALNILDREAFDLILMDVQMPEMDGFETTAAIRNKEKVTGGHVPIIAMTALAMKKDEERCIEAGMDTYVSKPFRSHELLAAIALHRNVPPSLLS